jgi:hypothetical protein
MGKDGLGLNLAQAKKAYEKKQKQHDKMIWIEPAKKNNKEKVGM